MGMHDLRQRSLRALLQNAIISPLSGVIIALSILLVGLSVRVPLVNAAPITWLFGLLPLWLMAIVINIISELS
jgi:hypothetical protein